MSNERPGGSIHQRHPRNPPGRSPNEGKAMAAVAETLIPEPIRPHRPATDAIALLAEESAQRVCADYGWNVDYATRYGALHALLTEMEQRNETPAEFVARVNGSS